MTLSLNPQKNAVNVPINSSISIHIKDDSSGVDTTSIIMKVNLNEVSPIKTGNLHDIKLFHNPLIDFDYNQRVTVEIGIKDLAGNEMETEYYSFFIEDKPQDSSYMAINVNPHWLYQEFNVDIQVKDVKGLFGIAFKLDFPSDKLMALSCDPGDFLGNDILPFRIMDNEKGEVSASFTKKAGTDGSNGTGVVAKLLFKEKEIVNKNESITLKLTEISANDSLGNNIQLTANDTTYITSEQPNTAPGIPQLISPENLTFLDTNQPTLKWEVPADNEGDLLHFNVEIALDIAFKNHIFGSPFNSQDEKTYFNPIPPVQSGIDVCGFTIPYNLDDNEFYWRITAYDRQDSSETSEIWQFSINTSSVNNEQQQIPEEFALYHNYPNPFNPTTTISYGLPKASKVLIQIFDINGRLVRNLVNEFQNQGIHSIEWNSLDNYNSRVSSGIYICRMSVGNIVLNKKLILTK